MKGVVLAGGLGTRLHPLTKVTNKHLLPVYDRPMIYYPIQTLVNAGIREILLVTGGNSAGDFLKLLGNGKEFGLQHLDYTYQEGEGGIADALRLAEFFADGGHVCVVLGDNNHRTEYRAGDAGISRPKAWRQDSAEGGEEPAAVRGACPGRNPGGQDRGKAEAPPVTVCRDRDLFLRWAGLRHHQKPETIGSRRARDHGRQQRLHSGRSPDLGCSGRLVD